MKKGDEVWIMTRVHRVAKDGSWIEVRAPTLPPKGPGHPTYTAIKRLDESGYWTKAVRIPPEAAFPDRK